ncbi:hypothetical protein [Sphingomonas lacusdianchii]|uniref:hypothetical protein n=1 Tax=Sphingomonas lacusdianchii TaxID=2917992 RepID=UPI001F58866F|nr:hypothetical protein [Sphingomonas sp. JXJ CY 53]
MVWAASTSFCAKNSWLAPTIVAHSGMIPERLAALHAEVTALRSALAKALT